MRYMWVCNRHMAPSYVLELIQQRGEAVVRRIFRTTSRSCWVFITNSDTYEWARSAALLDPEVGPWTITACNKQYVTNCTDAYLFQRYLGCLANVDLIEATTWINSDYNNWYLREPNTDQHWIPVTRNPNKVIPTGDSPSREEYRHSLKSQVRPWPLPAASYEEWRDEIVNKMIKTLDAAL